MSDPTSSINSSFPSPTSCDPSNACCEEPATATQPNAQAVAPLAPSVSPPVVTIPPVHVTGDASRSLVKDYDAKAAAACRNERNAAAASCPNIASAALESGLLTAGTASLVCAQLITAFDDCKETAVQRLKFADACEARGLSAIDGARPNEVICTRLPQ